MKKKKKKKKEKKEKEKKICCKNFCILHGLVFVMFSNLSFVIVKPGYINTPNLISLNINHGVKCLQITVTLYTFCFYNYANRLIWIASKVSIGRLLDSNSGGGGGGGGGRSWVHNIPPQGCVFQ